MSQKLSSLLWKTGFRSLLSGFIVLNIFVFLFFFREINDMYHKLTIYTGKIENLSHELIQEKQMQLQNIAQNAETSLADYIKTHNTLAKTLLSETSTPDSIQYFKNTLSNKIGNFLKTISEKYNLSSACVCDKFGIIIGQYGLDNYTYVDPKLIQQSQNMPSTGRFGMSKTEINYVIKLPTEFEAFLIIFKPANLHIFQEFKLFQAINEKANNLKMYWYLLVILIFLSFIGVFLFFSRNIIKKLSSKIINNLTNLLEAAHKIHTDKNPRELPEIKQLEITEFQNLADILIENQENLATVSHILKEKNAFINELDNISTGIILLDENNNIGFINTKAASLISCPEEGCKNRNISNFLPEIMDALKTLEPQQIDKNNHRLLIKLSKLEDKILLNLEDITYQISLQKQAAWRDVARVIAHEVKNPLTPTRLCAEQLLHHQDLSEEKKTKYLNTIINNVEHVNKLINDFTDFTKQTQQILSISSFSLIEIVEEIIQNTTLAFAHITFDMQIDKNLELVADRKQILQALTNLIQNAAQACDSSNNNCKVEISAEIHGDMCSVVIKDNGKGLATSSDKLFQPYMTTKTYGTGLGLVVVRKIAQTHGGSATLESLIQGAKATFTINIKTIE